VPFFLAFFAILLIVAGVKGTETKLLAQVQDDAKHFIVWFFLIVLVGSVGFSKTARPVSNAFLVLIVIAFVIGSGNAIIAGFKQLTSGVSK
jgi:ABC-type transport system involved in cytochrome c biogenesis permease subunit